MSSRNPENSPSISCYSAKIREFISHINTTPAGIPLVSSLFETAKQHSSSEYLAYINSDIILRTDFIDTLASVLQSEIKQDFLLTARRINIPLNTPLVNQSQHWRSDLDSIVDQSGSWDGPNAVDLFLFNRTLFDCIPDFAIGRMQWDNWLIWKARESNALVIDASQDFALLHPIHGYAGHARGWQDITQGDEAGMNRNLAQGHILGLEQGCTHLLKQRELVENNAENQRTLATHCTPSPEKEFTAYLRQQSVQPGSTPSEAETEPDKAIDVFRTLLWRNERYLPQDISTVTDHVEFSRAIESAVKHLEEGRISSAMDTIQDTLAATFLDRIRQSQATCRPIIIWGTGQMAERLVIFLKRNHIEITGFADSNADKAGRLFMSLPVTGSPIDQVSKKPGDRPFVIIGSMFVNEIQQALHNQGLQYNTDYCY